MNDLEKLTKIIQEAVPEIKDNLKQCYKCKEETYEDRPITLEDVLVASNKKHNTGASMKWDGILGTWQLNKPLSEQTPETINFLLETLSKQ